MDYWNHVMWSDETKINLFGSDGVKHVWWQPGEVNKDKCVLPTVKHGGGNVMVWGCMSAVSTGELQFIEGTTNANMYCDILKQSMIPSLRRLGRRTVFQHDNNPKHTSKTTIALLQKLRVKVICGHSQTEGEVKICSKVSFLLLYIHLILQCRSKPFSVNVRDFWFISRCGEITRRITKCSKW